MENQGTAPIPQTQVVPQTQGSAPVTPPPSEPKKKGFVKTIVIIVVVILIAMGAYVVYNLLSTRESGILNQAGRPSLPPTGVTDDFSVAGIDYNKWYVWSADTDVDKVHVTNGQLQINLPSGSIYNSGGVDTRLQVEGDFEATVDLSIASGGVDSSQTGLIFHDTKENWPNKLSIILSKEEGGTVMHAISFVNGESSYFGSRTYDNSGPFTVKISRLNGVATFSVLEEGEFRVIRTLTDFYKGDGFISLHVNSFEPSFPGVLSTFDNFSLSLK